MNSELGEEVEPALTRSAWPSDDGWDFHRPAMHPAGVNAVEREPYSLLVDIRNKLNSAGSKLTAAALAAALLFGQPSAQAEENIVLRSVDNSII